MSGKGKSGHRACPVTAIGRISGGHGSSGQTDSDFGELARLRIDFDSACVLFHDDIVADGETKAGALSGRFRREEGIEHLFFHFGRNAGAPLVCTRPRSRSENEGVETVAFLFSILARASAFLTRQTHHVAG